MIAIPHGLAAEVLRALQDGPRATGQIVDAIDKARGRGDEEPGVGLAPVWRALWSMTTPSLFRRASAGVAVTLLGPKLAGDTLPDRDALVARVATRVRTLAPDRFEALMRGLW